MRLFIKGKKPTFNEKSSFLLLAYSLSERWLKNIEEWSCAFSNISECGVRIHLSEFKFKCTDNNKIELSCKLFLCHRHKQSYEDQKNKRTSDNEKLMLMERRLKGYKF